MAIEGTKEVLLTFRFRCPPGIPPEVVAKELAHGGASITCGLLQYLKTMDCSVVPAVDVPPKLSLS